MAATPDRLPLMLGLAATFHCVPSQCSTNVKPPLPLPYDPTAQTLLAEIAATPLRKLELVPAFGMATWLHAPQLPGLRVRCGRIPADTPDRNGRSRVANAIKVIHGKMAIFRRFIKLSLVAYILMEVYHIYKTCYEEWI